MKNCLPKKNEYFLKMALNKLQQDGYIDFIAGEGVTRI